MIDPQRCDFCKIGHVVESNQPIAFRQWTNKGYVSCRVTIPMIICETCGSKSWDEEAEATLNEAVRKEYDKLP